MLLTACAPLVVAAPAQVPAPTQPLHMAHFDLAQPVNPSTAETSTPFQPDPATATPTDTPAPPTVTPTAIAAPTDTQAPTEQASNPTAEPTTTVQASSGRTHYTFYMSLDYAGRQVAVNETITYTNTTGQALNDIVMAVEPNLWNNCFTLVSLSQDNSEATTYDLSGQRLTLRLGEPLAPGGVANLALGYAMNLPQKDPTGRFGYTAAQVNLTDWFPFIVPYSGGWVLHDTWPFGETMTYDSADYDVNLKVSDPDVIVAASAPAEVNGDVTHYHLDAARTFALSASDRFKVDESAVGSIKIRSYYFAGDGDASQAVVWMATQSLALYQAKFAAYPYQSLSIVETSLADGQEFDGLVFLSSAFYSSYNGSARSNLVTIGTHEIAHQWWFGLVGDDQAMEPWLDEALAVYSERIFYEYNYPNYGDWWWNFRVNYFGPTGYVDSSVYSFLTFRGYVDAVYLNGANFLDDLRTRIGDEAFFAFLKDYAAQFSYRRATTADFFAVLRQHTSRDFSDIVNTYFQGSY
ncbi:MAG TPA: M1 family metallopeptidase [Anaerolineales bacterium]|nr:M1 family metallopeptidase [Anaerolineales bacterium]